MLFTNVDDATLEERIKKEEAAPEPLIILADGSSVTLSSVSLELSSFIEPEDLAVNFSIVKTKPREEVKIESGVVWWYIALPVLVVVLVVVAMGIVFYF